MHVLSTDGIKVRRWSVIHQLCSFIFCKSTDFSTTLGSQIRIAQWIETDLVENLFVIVSRIKLFLHSKDHSVGNQIIKFHSISYTFCLKPIPFLTHSKLRNHILFFAHSVFCTFHFLHISYSAPQCPRTDLNKRFLPRSKTTTA